MDEIRLRFEALVSPPSATSPEAPDWALLERASALISVAADPAAGIETVELIESSLDAIADSCVGSSGPGLARELFSEGRLRGNVANYYERDNSLLHRVLDRGLGIPITLSIVFISVAARRGVAVRPVGMPGHFVTRVDEGWIDAFDGGVLLDEEGCTAAYRRVAGPGASLPPGALDPTPTTEVLQRVLWNLRSIAEGTDDATLRHQVLGLLTTFPDTAVPVRAAWAASLAERGRFDQAAVEARLAANDAPEQSAGRLRQIASRWEAQLN